MSSLLEFLNNIPGSKHHFSGLRLQSFPCVGLTSVQFFYLRLIITINLVCQLSSYGSSCWQGYRCKKTIGVNYPEQYMTNWIFIERVFLTHHKMIAILRGIYVQIFLQLASCERWKRFHGKRVSDTVRMNAEPRKSGKKRKVGGLQQRLARADEAATEESAVHAVLMLLIAKGIMSGVLAHEIAQAAQRDVQGAREGKKIPDLEKLASIEQGRNLLRSVHDRLRRQSTLPEPVKVAMPYTDGLQEAHILLPHEWFAAMSEDDFNWERTICPNADRLPDFWQAWESHPGMMHHPMKRFENWQSKFIPISLHGDEVPVMGVGKIWSRSVLSITWMSMLANGLGAKMTDIVFTFGASLKNFHFLHRQAM